MNELVSRFPQLAMLTDPLFALPLATGAVYALLLPLIGAYLRLRDEWLAALAFAQTAAAGALLGLALALPPATGGLLGAVIAAAAKNWAEGRRGERAGATAYALLLIAGWALAVLLAANLPIAERLGHALFDGQLYFTDTEHLYTALTAGAVALFGLRRLSSRLLLARLFPDLLRCRGMAEGPLHLAFDLLAAAILGLATLAIGVMAAFALIFVPPLLAARWAKSWTSSLIIGVSVGIVGYLVAFLLALLTDQPFGPVLALLLVTAGAVGGLPGRR